ncbi:hypothetical protein B296_00050835 [Ensete ventricosum]|uniref:Uncharacterized protein n=1 Tax=Ensete ventricosum TaxID=4639 RepID=A0A426WXG5_ENSVE|nr:hypothetical protein B296_00050835 [Ensete ventricosum]
MGTGGLPIGPEWLSHRQPPKNLSSSVQPSLAASYRQSTRWILRLAKVKSMHRVDVVGNSLGVRRELAKGIRSLLGWRKGVCQKKTETRRKIIGGDSSKGLGSSLGTRKEITGRRPKDLSQECRRLPDWRDGISSTFARRFVKGIGKLTGNMSGDHREKTKRLAVRMSKAVKLAGVQAGIRKVEGTTFAKIPMSKPPMSDGRTATAAQVFGRLTMTD